MNDKNKQNGSAISRAIIAIGFMAAIVTLIVTFRDEIKVLIDPGSAPVTIRDLNEMENGIAEKVLAAITPEDGRAISPDRQAGKDKAARDVAETAPDAAQLIAEGRLDEGFARLETLARAKTTDAAQEWRDLGALAYDRDPERALNAFREAARLDASDFNALIYLSRLEDKQAGDVVAAKTAAEQALQVARNERDRSVALNTLGDIAMQAGDTDAARVSFTESLEIRRALSEANPGSSEAKRDVSISLNWLGNVALQAGDLDAARAAYTEYLEIARALSEANPGSSEAKRDVSVSLIKLGAVAIKAGDTDAALGFFTESSDILRALSEANPGSAEAKRDVSVSLNKLGDVAMKAGEANAAHDYFTEGLDIARALATANPGSAEAQRDVIFSLAKLGGMTGEFQYWQEALAIAEQMEANGQFAPTDAWMLEEIRKQIAAAG